MDSTGMEGFSFADPGASGAGSGTESGWTSTTTRTTIKKKNSNGKKKGRKGLGKASKTLEESIESIGDIVEISNMPHGNMGRLTFAVWSWMDDSGLMPYDPISQFILNRAYHCGESVVSLMDGRYEVNIGTMCQMNTGTGFQREVSRTVPSSSEEEAALLYLDTLEAFEQDILSARGLSSPGYLMTSVIQSFMYVSKRMRTCPKSRPPELHEQIQSHHESTKKQLLVLSKMAAAAMTENDGSGLSRPAGSFSFEGSSGKSYSLGRGGGEPSRSYGSDGYLRAPWAALGLLPYQMGSNGNERRDQVIRWRVHEVVLDDNDLVVPISS